MTEKPTNDGGTVRCTLEQWLEHGSQMVREGQVDNVAVTDREPEHIAPAGVGSQWGFQADGGFSPPLKPDHLPGVVWVHCNAAWHPTRDAARHDLSLACIAWARSHQ